MGIRDAALALLLIGVSVPGVPPGAQERDAEAILSAVVGVRASVPENARTARTLGTERVGSGVVIDADGLIVTIGYLILEADRVRVAARPGESPEVDAAILAYDHETGFGLLRASEPLDVQPMPLGDSDQVPVDTPVLLASYGGTQSARPALIVDRRDFAGYWEYLLEDALFVAPPHPQFGGAALIDTAGALLGVGSLVVNDARAGERPLAGNMVVPVNRLKPILGELMLSGRGPGPARPWLGLYAMEADERLVVQRVARDGPAERAGVVAGSTLRALSGEPIADMAAFYRRLWASAEPGDSVTLTLQTPTGQIEDVELVAGDRYDWLRLR